MQDFGGYASHFIRLYIPFTIILCLKWIFTFGTTDNITAIAWHPSSRYLATAGGNDRQIRVWHNAVGIKVEIDALEGRLVRAKSDTIRVNTKQRRARSPEQNMIGLYNVRVDWLNDWFG